MSGFSFSDPNGDWAKPTQDTLTPATPEEIAAYNARLTDHGGDCVDPQADAIAKELATIDRLSAELGKPRLEVARELAATLPHSPLRRFAYEHHLRTTPAPPLPVDAEQARADAAVYDQWQRMKAENPFAAERFRAANASAIARRK